MPFSIVVTPSIWKKEKRAQNDENNLPAVPQSHVLHHLLFPLVTSALTMFMWPLLRPLTSTERHLLEVKALWHNHSAHPLMWFMLLLSPWVWCDRLEVYPNIGLNKYIIGHLYNVLHSTSFNENIRRKDKLVGCTYCLFQSGRVNLNCFQWKSGLILDQEWDCWGSGCR